MENLSCHSLLPNRRMHLRCTLPVLSCTVEHAILAVTIKLLSDKSLYLPFQCSRLECTSLYLPFLVLRTKNALRDQLVLCHSLRSGHLQAAEHDPEKAREKNEQRYLDNTTKSSRYPPVLVPPIRWK